MKPSVLPIAAVAVIALAAGVFAVRVFDAGGVNPNLSRVRSHPPRTRPAARCPPVTDLSVTYGRVNQTIFNKKTRVVFAWPHEFYSDSGLVSFDRLKFDELSRLPADLSLVNGRRLTRQEIAVIENMP